MAWFKKDSEASQANSEVTARFIEFIMMLAQETLFFLGKIPHPSTGKGEVNLEVAKLRIDQLEIIELKTRGNRTGEEDDALKQALQAIRLAFVEVAGVGARESLNGEADQTPSARPVEPKEVAPPPPESRAQTRFPSGGNTARVRFPCER
ncbi:DUF1844 domain-containing protein [Kamptonema cortianum]|nr:DUF1844 domain-containing protein [Kamptonema cortianum]